MNIVYSSDENYVQHLCVSLVSLLDNNKGEPQIDIYIISNSISEKSKNILSSVVEDKFGRALHFIDFLPYSQQLKLNMEWPISLSSYARLFLCEMLPESCEKVIYLDCDTVICNSLKMLWEYDLQGLPIGGVIDSVLPKFKEAVGLSEENIYINAGVLLIDLKSWRQNKIQDLLLNFIASKNGTVSHHDQGTINGCLKNQICVLPICYNAMTPVFTTRYSNLLKFYSLSENNFYKKSEFKLAKSAPIIIHYVPEFVGRVWEYECTHPKKDIYFHYLSQTPWKDCMVHSNHKDSLKTKLAYFIRCKWPYFIYKVLFK